MNKTVGAFQIEWVGFRKVLIHTLWVALASLVAYVLSALSLHDFGAYNAIVVVVLGFVGTFAEKFFAGYDIPLVIKPME